MPVEAFNFVAGVLDKSWIFISVISQIELLGFRFPSFEEQIATEDFVIDSNILELYNEIVNKTIEIRKKRKIKLPDAIIAATAIVYGYTLITRNSSDFVGISDLSMINPFEN